MLQHLFIGSFLVSNSSACLSVKLCKTTRAIKPTSHKWEPYKSYTPDARVGNNKNRATKGLQRKTNVYVNVYKRNTN